MSRNPEAMVVAIVPSSDSRELFLVADGVRVAKRGQQPGRVKTWVSLVPGWEVAELDGEFEVKGPSPFRWDRKQIVSPLASPKRPQ
jgi:hypothetical protein